MLGFVTLKFKIGRTDINHKSFIICNTVKPLILGSDLLIGGKDLKIKIDCSNKSLNKEEIVLDKGEKFMC